MIWKSDKIPLPVIGVTFFYCKNWLSNGHFCGGKRFFYTLYKFVPQWPLWPEIEWGGGYFWPPPPAWIIRWLNISAQLGLIMLTTFPIVNQKLFHIFKRLIRVLSTLLSINYYILQIIHFLREKISSCTFHLTLQ